MRSVESLLDIVISNTYEVDILRHRLTLWRLLLEKNLFSGEGSLENSEEIILKTLARAAHEQTELPEHIEAVEQWMRSARLLTKDSVHDLFDELEEQVADLPILSLSLAVDLPRKEREQLGKWVREQIHPKILIDLRRDPSVLGGAVIVWDNKEVDQSLRLRLQRHRSAIRESFSSLVKSSKRSNEH